MNSDDIENLTRLIQEAARGNRAAFEDLYRQTSPRLYSVALQILRNSAWAQDILQESFITIWHKAASYQPGLSSPQTWLTHIVRNRAIDGLRTGSARYEITSDDELDTLVSNSFVNDDPLQHIHDGVQNLRLKQCLSGLPSDQQQTVVLAYYQGMSHAEVSEFLRQPLGTIKSWIRRGLEQLKGCLGL
ncbi:sigma-70 family RNA polymerase sigma factor [Hafnia paralvei]|uniref:RNA polymerase sigma factor n=1 Tax=Hafnia paralvei TaxID=546367 RepID=A0A4Q9EF83_9GAMM|nr:sigma-70 family RNA polymerase sigma factor [Hafnia paralvei]TBM22848.1 sigma-70 family RNA polymerase sigma factor [Hafnia paralvei]